MTNLQKYNLLKATLLRKFSVDHLRQKVDEEASMLQRAGLLKRKDRVFLKEKDHYRNNL